MNEMTQKQKLYYVEYLKELESRGNDQEKLDQSFLSIDQNRMLMISNLEEMFDLKKL